MRQFRSLLFSLSLATAFVGGCGKTEAPREAGAREDLPALKLRIPQIHVGPKARAIAEPDQEAPLLLPALGVDQEKYQAALTEALNFMADRKYAEALVSLETARSFQDSDFIKGEIAKVKGRQQQATAAQKTVQDIETVLADGQAADAAKLSQQGLRELGGGEWAPSLVKLRLQADALQNVDSKEDSAARYQRFRDEGEAALREQNLRAAALAFEQALLAQDDGSLKEKLAGIRSALEQYDSLRRRAAELRHDPARLDDALDALKEAAQAWDTVPIRQEIDECTLALQKRRDTVSVADFEIRGELGIADAGRTFAEELLPLLKRRFDLVERGQVAKVLDELKLQAGFLDDPGQQREVGRLAKVRYLVLGSVTRLAGLTINARLVDVRTGLVMQTAKIVAPSAQQILPLLPELAKQLLMSDEDKLAYEQEQTRLAKRLEPAPEDAPLPPPPALPDIELPAQPAYMAEVPLPADFGGLRLEAFQGLAPPPPGGALPLLPPVNIAEVRVKHRLLHAVLSLGDDLFRRGNFREAERHFDFALTLAPGEFDVRLRLERCQPLVPPLVVSEQPLVQLVPRPRIAILNFMTVGEPAIVAPGLGPWTAVNLAPYFQARFEVVDPNEVYWYMGKLGMTLNDLMQDAGARRWLGRALNVRYFVLGTIQQTASFDAATYMLDAEYGFLQGSARVHVHNSYELKLRLAELAGATLMDPNERNRYLADAQRFAELVARGRQALDQREYSVAGTAFASALQIRPGNVEVLAYLDYANNAARQSAWEEEGRRRLAAEEAFRRRQWDCAQAAEAARISAVLEAARYDPAERERHTELRRRAQVALLGQARLAIRTKNVSVSLGFFDGAIGLAPPTDDVIREFAVARAEGERLARAQSDAQLAVRAAALRAQAQLELTQARQQLDEENRRNRAALDLQARVQEQRDKIAFQRGFDEAQRLLARNDYAAAIGALQSARQPAQQVGKADLVEALLNTALVEQAKGPQRADLEAKLAAERSRRRQAEKDAKQKEAQYQAALQVAQQALAAKNLDVAQTKFQEAAKLYPTDTVRSGLQNVAVTRDLKQAEAVTIRQKPILEQQRAAQVKTLLADGQNAHAAQQFEAAVSTLAKARQIAPDNVDVAAALVKAEQARNQALAASRRQAEEVGRAQNFQKLLKNGQDNLAAKQYDAAIANLSEASKLNPADLAAKTALAQARQAHDNALADAGAQAAARQKIEAYQKLIGDGKTALAAQRYDDAIQTFVKAQSLVPGDKTLSGLLEEARAQKQNEASRLSMASKKKADDLQRAADLNKATQIRKAQTDTKVTDNAALQRKSDQEKALIEARKRQKSEQAKQQEVTRLLTAAAAATQAKHYGVAQKNYIDALKLSPNDPSALRGLQDVQRLSTPTKTNETPKTYPIPQPRPNPMSPVKVIVTPFQKEMQDGAAWEKNKKYPEALKSYRQALKLAPADAQAKDNVKRLELTVHVMDGQKYLDTMKYAEAVREFEAALLLAPNNPAIAKLLAKAKQMKK